MHWRWLPVLLSIYSIPAVYSRNQNYFISPDYSPDGSIKNYTIGSTLNVTWHTNSTEFAIQLWQRDPDLNSATPSVTTVFNQTSSDPEITSINWIVTPYELDIDVSHTFYFYITPLTGTSAYFKIYNSSADFTSPSSSSSATSHTTNPSDSTSSPTAATAATAPHKASSDSNSLAIGLGVGLGVGLPLAILCGVCIGLRMRKRRNQVDTYQQPQGPPASGQAQKSSPLYAYKRVMPAPLEIPSAPIELEASQRELDTDGHAREPQMLES